MNRYQNTPFLTGPNNVKYPEIPRDPSDIYVYTGRGDRYDTLATQYYNDSSLWWIIPIANSNQTPDSLIPNIGSQLRIPSNERIPNIIASYNSINMVS